MRVAIRTDLAGYREAAAELPLSVHLVEGPGAGSGGAVGARATTQEIAAAQDRSAAIRPAERRSPAQRDARGAIVVVDGRALGRVAWWDAAAAAIESGAVAIVVADPASLPPDEWTPGQVPLIVDRPVLRADVVADAEGFAVDAPHAVSALSQGEPAAQLDAIGWLRVLAGGPLRIVGEPAPGAPVLLEPREGAGIAVALTATSGNGMPRLLRAVALAPTRVEVAGEGERVHVTATGADGIRTAPRRFERHERLALRRALAALATDETPADLDELRHDAALAAAILTVAP